MSTSDLIGKVGSSIRNKREKAVYPGEFSYEFYDTLAKVFIDEDNMILYIWANVLKVKFFFFTFFSYHNFI